MTVGDPPSTGTLHAAFDVSEVIGVEGLRKLMSKWDAHAVNVYIHRRNDASLGFNSGKFLGDRLVVSIWYTISLPPSAIRG